MPINYKDFIEYLEEAKGDEKEVESTSDYKLDKAGRKHRRAQIVFNHGEDDGKTGITEEELDEAKKAQPDPNAPFSYADWAKSGEKPRAPRGLGKAVKEPGKIRAPAKFSDRVGSADAALAAKYDKKQNEEVELDEGYGMQTVYQHEKVTRLPAWLKDNPEHPIKVGDEVHRSDDSTVKWKHPVHRKWMNLRLGSSYSKPTGKNSELNEEVELDEEKIPVQHVTDAVHRVLGQKSTVNFLTHLRPGTEKHTSWDKVNAALVKQGAKTQHIASIAAEVKPAQYEEVELDEGAYTLYKQKLHHIRVDPTSGTDKERLGKIGKFGERSNLANDDEYKKALADAHEYGKTQFGGKYEITHMDPRNHTIRGGSVSKVRREMSKSSATNEEFDLDESILGDKNDGAYKAGHQPKGRIVKGKSYGADYQDDEDDDGKEKKKAAPEVKRGRGRPKKGASETGEVKKYTFHDLLNKLAR